MWQVSSSLIHAVETWGLAAILLTMIVESCGIPLSIEVVAPIGGALAAQGRINLAGVILAATIGNVIGSLIAYWLARRFGRAIVLGPGRWIGLSEGHLELAERFFGRFGAWAAFVGRFLPVIRTYISFPAGLAEMSLVPFTLLTALGSLIWAGALAYAGFRLGQHWQDVERALGVLTIPFLLVAIALVVVAYVLGRRWVHGRTGAGSGSARD